MPVGLVFSVCVSVFVCLYMCVCVCLCIYVCVCISCSIRLAFGTVFYCTGESNSHSNYEMCQVQQTVTNLWQAAHTRPGPDPPTVQHPLSPCYLLVFSSTPLLLLLPVVLLVLWPRSPLVIQLKCKKILTLRAPANGACALLLVLAVSICVCMFVYTLHWQQGVCLPYAQKINQSAAIYLLLSEVSAAINKPF